MTTAAFVDTLGVSTFEWAISKGVVGVLSLVILAMVYVIRSLWEQVNKLQAAKDLIQAERLADAAKNTTALLNVQEKTHEAIAALEKTSEGYERVVNDYTSPQRRPRP